MAGDAVPKYPLAVSVAVETNDVCGGEIMDDDEAQGSVAPVAIGAGAGAPCVAGDGKAGSDVDDVHKALCWEGGP